MFSPNRKKPTPNTEPKPVSREIKRRMWATVALTFILIIIWFGCIAYGDATHNSGIVYAVMFAYSLVFAVTLVGYLIYNRAFVNKDVTVDMLPDEWSDEKKQAFVEGNRIRAEKSRWMVAIIIPFAIVFMIEAVYLFLWDGYLANFFKG